MKLSLILFKNIFIMTMSGNGFTGRGYSDHRGFTIIELLIAVAITAIVSLGVFSAFQSQQDAHLAQKQIVEMQQNLRAALFIIADEVRMAGYDPEGNNNVGILNAGDGSMGNPFHFSYYYDHDNNPLTPLVIKNIEYSLYDAYGGDGDMDVGRTLNGNKQPVAENVSNFQFVYLNASGSTTTSINNIRAIQLTVETTTDSTGIDYTNGVRRSMTTIIKCRNLF